ncbi:MAG TPA: hypothetical protein VGG82_05130 [Casimicrobiaceae bacterium]|jgi:hypothetical protein
MVDSFFEYCPVCREEVLLNQTQRQCAREHACEELSKCVLRRLFTGIEFRERSTTGVPKKDRRHVPD